MVRWRWTRQFCEYLSVSLTGVLIATATCLAEEVVHPIEGPLSVEKSLKEFRLEPGLAIEVVAAEPIVESPVALTFDERGRLFVAENRGYPTGPGEGQPPVGRIALLEDRDSDGRYDHRIDFADGLTFPNGLMPWNGGLIVTCAPDVLFLKDTDGDGRADQREVLLTGFSTAGSTQLRVSHPVLGTDNWIYLTSGLMGGSVTSPRDKDRPPVELKRTDLRFRPNENAFEPADGGAQFGQTFDDWGRRFICYNRVQVQHVVLSSQALRRNSHLAFSETVQNCPAETVPEPLKGHGAGARLFPLSANVTTADSHAGTFTAACAVTIYRGSGLPDEYRGGAFSCDPTGNLVHFDFLKARGATFEAHRRHDGIEFVASPDNWFRPVYLAHAPDGGLYICDMYRKTIEHPDYLPVEVRKHTDFEGGKGMGRIYRVVNKAVSFDQFARRRQVDFSSATTIELCHLLGSENGWHRDTARRLLLERHDPQGVPTLEKLITGNAYEAVHSLHLLDSLGALAHAHLVRGLAHPSSEVREAALAFAAFRREKPPELAAAILKQANDDAPRVRLNCAIACGEIADPKAVSALANIAVRDSADRWMRAAVFSSSGGREVALLDELLCANNRQDAQIELFSELGRLLGASQAKESWPIVVARILNRADLEFAFSAALLAGLSDAVRNSGAARDRKSTLDVFAPEGGKLRDGLDRLLTLSLERAVAREETPVIRQTALNLLAHADFNQAGKALLPLVVPSEPAIVQAGAMRALGSMTDPCIAEEMLEEDRFAAYTPTLREEVLSALLGSPQHAEGIVAALESGAVPLNAVDPLRRKRLTEHKDPAIRERATKLYAAVQTGDRARVYEEYKSLLELAPDSENGRAVFKKNCAVCHRLDREGAAVGPDLFGIRNQPKEVILMHILNPDAEITPGFAAYIVETKSGRVVTGLLASETSSSVTLRQQLGKEETVLRNEIESLLASKQSLMPQGIEKSTTRQELADLISYLKGEQIGK